MVSGVENVSGHFRTVELQGESLRGEPWVPGQKIQFHLGNLMTRTYTPTCWNAVAGSARFLFFLHGNGPGSEWAASLKKGDQCLFIGPRSSLDFAEISVPSVFFGDETSIGAAQALHLSGNGSRQNHYVLEVSSVVESEEVLRRVELNGVEIVQRLPSNGHLEEAARLLSGAASRMGLPQWIFTGKAQSIQALRKMLLAQRVLFSRIKVKAYWAEGKTGLD